MSWLVEALPPAAVLAAVRAPFEAIGGDWVDPPILQPLNLLLDLAGEVMRARLLIVQAEGAEACLRPDFTIPIARMHIARGVADGRYLYSGKAFRATPRNSARPVESWQVGVESFGQLRDPARWEAEAAALAWTAAEAGGRRDLGLHLGDIGLVSAFVQAIGVEMGVQQRLLRAFSGGRGLRAELEPVQARGPGTGSGRLAGLLSELPETEAAGVLEELWRLAGIQPVGGRSPAEIVHRLTLRSEPARSLHLTPAEGELVQRLLQVCDRPAAALEQVERLAYEARVEFDVQLQPWIRRLEALVEAGVPEQAMTLAPGFVRPFGYYDGLLFEVRSEALGPDRPVAAGGRYDGLLARLGARASGAVGCMVRPARAWAGATV